MPKTITEDGEPVQFLAHYWRHFHEYRDPCDSLEEAFNFLYWGREDDQLAYMDVLNADGSVRLGILALDALFGQADEARDAGREFDLDEALMRTQRAIAAGERTESNDNR